MTNEALLLEVEHTENRWDVVFVCVRMHACICKHVLCAHAG